MVKILFICHGNICRSTMAEFYMKHIVAKAGLSDSIYVESAATSREEIGKDTHYGTKQKLDEMGIPYTRRDVKDPWYTGNFDETYDDISRSCDALLELIKEKI